MKFKHAAFVCVCAGLLPGLSTADGPPLGPAATAVPLASWDPASSAPFYLADELVAVDQDHRIDGHVILQDHAGLDVQTGRTLTLDGPVRGDSTENYPGDPAALRRLLKLGDGHLALNGSSDRIGGTVLLRGSLSVGHDQALGRDHNSFTMVAGTRLTLADGVTVRQSLIVLKEDPDHLIPAGWGMTPPQDPTAPTVLHVAGGEATLAGVITSHTPLVKDGAGTLRLTEFNQSISGDALTVQGGGLRVDGLWLRGAIHTDPGTVLSGSGYIQEAHVAGHLRPGGPDAVGTLMFDQRLQLQPTAQTRIRIDAQGGADGILTWGTARLGGELQVVPTPGTWTPQTRWTIVRADTGLDLGAPATPDAVAGDGRFARATSTLRYLDPMLTYTSTSVILGLDYNRWGLNTVDGAWRSALIEDSRFLRESALAHTARGQAWAQTWGANAGRAATDGLPGDDRDTSGLQIGISCPISGSSALAKGWHLAAFAGVQATDQSSHADPQASPYGARDTAVHIGLGASRALGHARLTLGAAQTWHHARLRRQADPSESDLRSRTAARLTQLWVETRPDRPVNLGGWGVTPYARLAWLRLHRPTVQEESRRLAAVSLSAQTDQRWISHLGIELQRRLPAAHGNALVTANVGVQSLWGGRTLDSPQFYRTDATRTFHVASHPLVRHALRLDVGVQAPLSRRTRVGLAYTGSLGGGQMQHGVWLGVGMMF